MIEKEEIQIGFNLWELLSQLSALLWGRYFDEFNSILYEFGKNRGMEKDFPF